jgi:Tol biopolymer transport system component
VVDTGVVETFPTPGAAHSPSWSPVTDRIAYLEAIPATGTTRSQTHLGFMDSRGGRLYPDLPKTATFANGFLEWAPDGKRVAVVAAQSNIAASIWIVEPDAREPFRKLLDLPVNVRIRGLTWSPDGTAVIIARQEMPSDIVLFDLKK